MNEIVFTHKDVIITGLIGICLVLAWIIYEQHNVIDAFIRQHEKEKKSEPKNILAEMYEKTLRNPETCN